VIDPALRAAYDAGMGAWPAGLVYRTNYGALTFWSGRDGVDIDADMGGQWISDSSWRAWQQ
jgi:hypothetical protein